MPGGWQEVPAARGCSSGAAGAGAGTALGAAAARAGWCGRCAYTCAPGGAFCERRAAPVAVIAGRKALASLALAVSPADHRVWRLLSSLFS